MMCGDGTQGRKAREGGMKGVQRQALGGGFVSVRGGDKE